MTRRAWFRSLFGVCVPSLALALSRKAAAGPEQANLNETLRYVLRARRPQELAFVDLVTQKVKEGKLPTEMVLSMMKWAVERARERGNKIPFPYFQEGLRIRAKEIGVDLPPLTPVTP
jgi:hypothetical protein